MSRALRNSAGHVLKNAAGKIMRGNYDFGKGITNIEGVVPALVGRQYAEYSQELWYKNPNSSNHGYTMLVTELGTGFTSAFQASGKAHYGTITTTNAVLASTSTSTKAYAGFRMTAATGVGDAYFPSNNSEKKSTGISPFPAFNAPITEFRIGKGKLAHVTPGSYNLIGNSELPLVRLYSRLVSGSEVANNYNKGLGADPVSGASLLIELRMNRAEMLDFSAAQDAFNHAIPLNHLGNLAAAPASPSQNDLYYDTTLGYSRIWTGSTWRKIGTAAGEADIRVGVRNYGSLVNGHLQLEGLPAGNMQEKTNFANANYFKSYN